MKAAIRMFSHDGRESNLGTFDSVITMGSVVMDEDGSTILEAIITVIGMTPTIEWRDFNDDMWTGWKTEPVKG